MNLRVIVLAVWLAAATGMPAAVDAIPTANGDLRIQPINHATVVLAWNKHVIYVDPVGGPGRFTNVAPPTLILVTDIHGDHLDIPTLEAISTTKTLLVAPPAVADKLPKVLRGRTLLCGVGETNTVAGIPISALPAYNLTEDRLKYHANGRGVGYLLTLGGKLVYISGDTEDIPEMRALKGVDIAFLCMNLPYTMTVEQAARAVLSFKPKMVYPYHYRGSDVEQFKKLAEADQTIEVRLREWYAK